jgi:hypothetical protein
MPAATGPISYARRVPAHGKPTGYPTIKKDYSAARSELEEGLAASQKL